jgi:D-alanine--poly(phosphoribitol) ligase subunit 2
VKAATDGLSATGARILAVLRDVTGADDVLIDPDVALYDSGLLDSLATVTLLVSFEEAFGLAIAPSDLDRAAWATPRRLVADVERRLAEAEAAR